MKNGKVCIRKYSKYTSLKPTRRLKKCVSVCVYVCLCLRVCSTSHRGVEKHIQEVNKGISGENGNKPWPQRVSMKGEDREEGWDNEK